MFVKMKINTYMFLVSIIAFPVLVLFPAWIAILTEPLKHINVSEKGIVININGDSIAFVIMIIWILSYIIYTIRRRHDIFSTVTISEEGVTASFWGDVWFHAKWDEIVEAGEICFSGGRGPVFYGIYLSKVQDVISNRFARNYIPYHKALKGNTLFIVCDDKKSTEILKYVDKSLIIDHGDYSGRNCK